MKTKSFKRFLISIVSFVYVLALGLSAGVFSNEHRYSGNAGAFIVETSSEGLTGSSSNQDFTFKSYTLTSLVDARTLTNTDTSKVAQDALTTKDLIWLPSYEGTEINSSNYATKADPTGINTMLYNIFGASNNQNRLATPSDYAVANNTSTNNNYHSNYDPYYDSTTSSKGRTNLYWLRSPYSNTSVCTVFNYGYVNFPNPEYATLAARPALQFNLESIISARSALNVQIDSTNKTIVIPNIMYPQTKVTAGSTLETNLEAAYNSGTLQNGMFATGRVYAGYNTINGSGSATNDSYEYFFDGNYYTRTKISKNNNNNKFSDEFEDGATVLTSGYAWFKVEPITWYITNWANMPKSINPNGDETATEIIVLSQYGIVNVGAYYSTQAHTGSTLWQNSRVRAYLNGYDLAEQNNGTNGSNDPAYLAPTQANFKNSGFAQTVWHDLKPSLIVPTTLQNNGFNSDGSAFDSTTNDLTTIDDVWLPSANSASSDPTSIYNMLPNSKDGRKTTATDWALANYTQIMGGDPSNTPHYWLRTAHYGANQVLGYYILYDGSVNNISYWDTISVAARPCMQFDLNFLSSMYGVLNIEIRTDSKTIVIPQIMYPQSKVAKDSNLEVALNNAYNGGNLRNGMSITGKKYGGWQNKQSESYYTNYSEYYFNGNYYVYARVNRWRGYGTGTIPFSDEESITVSNGSYVWFKVEPIVWYISNWDNMPIDINPSSTSVTPDATMYVISNQAMVEVGTYSPTVWQNGRYRAYLNGYDLWDENTYGNGSTIYKSANQANFKGNGFVDTVWHANYTTAYIDNADGQDGAMGVSVTTPVKTMGRLDEVLADNPTIDTICFVDSLTIDDDFVTNYGSVVDFRNYNLVGNNGMQKALINVTASTDVVLKNLKIDGSVFSPITITGSGAVTIVDSTFTNCTGVDGAAIQMTDESSGALVVKNCLFTNCTSAGNGGAICCADTSTGALNVDNCTFVSCTATTSGGAIYQGGAGNVTIANCIFGSFDDANANGILDNNETITGGCTATNGGAIYKAGNGAISIDGCVFYGSSATNTDTSVTCNGGAINIAEGSANINSCKFYSCSARNNGGAIYQTGAGTLVLTNSTFGMFIDANSNGTYESSDDTIAFWCSASYYGGGLFSSSTSKVVVENCNFYGDRVSGSAAPASQGGGIYRKDGDMIVSQSNFINCRSSNSASGGSGGSIYFSSSNILQVNNCFFDAGYTFNTGVFIQSEGKTFLTNSSFQNISSVPPWAGVGGAAVHASNDTTINGCVFSNNVNYIISFGAQMKILVINNSIFENNQQAIVSATNWMGNRIIIDSSTFKNNSSTIITHNNLTTGEYAGDWYLEVNDCNFIENGGNVITDGFKTTIRNSNFINNTGRAITIGVPGYQEISSKKYYKFATQQNKTLTVENCNFSGNSVTGDIGGGAILSNFATTKIIGCVFDGNSANSIGGAILYQGAKDRKDGTADGTLTIEGSTFVNNSTVASSAVNIYPGASIAEADITSTSVSGAYTANGGGAVCILGGNANITGSTFGGFDDTNNNGAWDSGEDSLGNTSASDGGAIWMKGGYIITSNNSNFLCNVAANGGVCYKTQEDDRTICNFFQNCNFSYNVVSENGGVFHSEGYVNGASLKLVECNITYNAAFGMGGVFWSTFTVAYEIERTYIGYNYAKGNGGVIFSSTKAYYKVSFLKDCIVEKNVAKEGSAFHQVQIKIIDSKVTNNVNTSGMGVAISIKGVSFGLSIVSTNNKTTIIKNNYAGADLVENFARIVNPNDSNEQGKIIKSGVFDSNEDISVSFASAAIDSNICGRNTDNGDVIASIDVGGFFEIWFNYDLTLDPNGTVIANASISTEAFAGIHYDNAEANHVKLYLQDGKIYAKVVDENLDGAFAYTASDYVGYYDSNAHGIDVKVYNFNSNEYKIEYSLVDFALATSSDILDECPTQLDAGTKTIYYRITDLRTGVTNFASVTGSNKVTISKKTVSVKFDNATFSGLNFGETINANTTVINDYLKGVIAVDNSGNAVSGTFYLTSAYTPTPSAYTLNGKNLKFVPDNPNYETVNSVAINTTNVVTPIFEFDTLYFNNGNFFVSASNATGNTNGFSATFAEVIKFLKPVSTIYFMSTYTVSNNEEIDIGSKFVTFARYTSGSSTSNATFMSVQSGKTLTILATGQGAKLVVSGSTNAANNSLFSNAGTLTLNGTIELTTNTITGANTSSGAEKRYGAGIYSTGTLNVTGVKFTNLSANLGGAIYASGTAALKSCYFASNLATNSNSVQQGSAIYIAGGTQTIENCTMIANTMWIANTPTVTFKNSYISSTIYVDSTTGGELKLIGSLYISTLQYYLYDGSTYKFKVTDANLSGDSKIVLSVRNTSKDADLIAVYNEIASDKYYNTIFSLSVTITDRVLGVTSAGYYGLIDTTASSSSSTPTPGASGTIGASGSGNVTVEDEEIDLYDLIVPTTLQNDDSSGNIQDYLQTSDYIWIPSGKNGWVDSNDNTNINTMTVGVFGSNSDQNRKFTPSDYSIANYAKTNNENHSNYDPYYDSEATPNKGRTAWSVLRSVQNIYYLYGVEDNGNVKGFKYVVNNDYAERPALQFNVSSIISSRDILGIEIDTTNRTITIPQIMYPQTKVPAGSTLETNLNNAYNDGNLQNGITLTGTVYAGHSTSNGSGSSATDSYEYYFNGNYYTRTKISKSSEEDKFSDELEEGSEILTSGYVWIKVEPIVWYITNWTSMPSELTNGMTSGSANTIIALSQYGIINVGGSYPNHNDSNRPMWQNSRLRAYLNGYDLTEQNNGTNGNEEYVTPIKFNFKGHGFIDTIWHSNQDNFIVYFDSINGDDSNRGFFSSESIKTISKLMEVLNSNSALNTICFKNTLTVDSATTLDFGGLYLTSFDDGTNAFTGDFFNVTTTSAVTIKNIKVDGGATDTTGKNINSIGGLRLSTASGSNVTLTNLDIHDCTSQGVYLSGTGTVNVSNVKIYNNNLTGTSVKDGAGIYSPDGSVNISNSDIFNNNAGDSTGGGSGGGIYVPYGSLTMTDCNIYNNQSGLQGGGMAGKMITATKCNIYGNKSFGAEGGGIRAGSDGLTLANCHIYNNTSGSQGGGAYSDATLSMTGCKIYNNTSSSHGGAIYAKGISTAIATIDGCEVYNNNGDSCSGIYINAGNVTITNCDFYNNASSEKFYYGANVYCSKDLTIVDSKFHDNNANRFSGGIIYALNVNATNCLFYNNKAVSNSMGAIYGLSSVTAKNCKFYNNNQGSYSNGGAVLSYGAILLEDCVFYDNYAGSGGAVCVYMSGYTASAKVEAVRCDFYNNEASRGAAIYCPKTVKLINCNCYKNMSREWGVEAAACVYSGGKVTAINTNIFNNLGRSTYADGGSGGIYTLDEVELIGCNIYNNAAAGTVVYAVGKIDATNCNIYNNKTNNGDYGGGGLHSDSILVVSNSNIYNNTAAGAGGGIYAGGTVEATNCNIYCNQANNHGGAIYSGSSVELSGCNIYNNNSVGGGCGGIRATTTVDAAKCNIYNNVSSGTGGGINADGKVTLDNCNIYNNTSVGSGAGVYCASTSTSTDALTLTNCNIYNNIITGSTDYNGGGVCCSGKTSFTNCNVYNNIAGGSGGGIYSGSAITAISCNIYNNTAQNNGGGIMAATSVTATNCNVYDNISSGSGGGGISSAGLNMKNCKIFNNISSGDGGGFLSHSTVNLMNCNIYSNQCGIDGGAGVCGNTGTIINCNIFNNVSTRLAGGIYGASLILTNSNIYNNFAKGNSGGGVYAYSRINAINSNIYNNMATGSGGGLWCGATLDAINCNIYNNNSNSNGGGIYSNTSVTASGCNIYANVGLDSVVLATSLTFNSCTLSGNTVSNGAVISCPNVTITDSKIANNNSKIGLFAYSTSSFDKNLQTLFLTNSTIYGNTYNFLNETSGYGLIYLGQVSSGQGVATITNCEFHSNVGLTENAGGAVIANNGGVLTIDSCRFANNLSKTSSSYKFCGVVTEENGKTTITNSNLSHNKKNNLGTAFETGEHGLVFFDANSLDATLDNLLIINNNLGNSGAIVANNKVLLADTLFENNTGKLAKFGNNLEMFNVVVSNNDFNGECGIEITGNFEVYNIIVEGNENGSALKTCGAGIIEKLVADSNSATHTVGNKGAVIYNTGILALSDTNTLFSKFLNLIFTRDIEVNAKTMLTNNSAFYGGVIYNDFGGNLTLNGITIGENGNGNIAYYGGAVYNELGGNLTINGAKLQHNTAHKQEGLGTTLFGNGGGVYNLGTLVMNSGDISNNTAQNGGGLYNLGTLTINGGEIKSNKASLSGAGIANTTESFDTTGDSIQDTTYIGSLVINYAEISLNSLADTPTGTNAYGAGIYNDGNMIINNGLFEGNTRASNSINSYGGAIYALGKKNYVYGGTFYNNVAAYGGTFCVAVSSELNVSEVLIHLSSDSTSGQGGYILGGSTQIEESNLKIRASTINGNSNSGPKTFSASGSFVKFLISDSKFQNILNSETAIAYLEFGQSLVLKNCYITGLSQSKLICANSGSSVELNNCNFVNNDSDLYELFDLTGAKLIIEKCSFESNNTQNLVIRLANTETLIKDSIFKNNKGEIINLNGDMVVSLTLNNVKIVENVGTIINNETCQDIVLKGVNIIQNNVSTGLVAGVNMGIGNNNGLLKLGFGGKLIVVDNYIVTSSSLNDYDFKINGQYYKKLKESNIVMNASKVNLISVEGGLQEKSKIGISIYSSDESFDLSSLVGTTLFKGTNVTSNDFDAFYMDNNAGVLKLQNNEFILASTNPISTVIISDKVFVVDGKYHSLEDADFEVYNFSGERLSNSDSEINYVVTYSLTEDGEYSLSSPKFVSLGTYTIYYKVYLGNRVTGSPLASGSVPLSIVKKVMSLIETPTALLSKGDSLGNTTFIGGLVVDNFGNAVAGVWSFANLNTTPTDETTTYNLTFTPNASNAYGNNVTGSCPVSFKLQFVTYKTVESTKGFYNSKTGEYTGIAKLEDITKYIGKNGIITLEETYVFETSESVNFTEDVFFVWNSYGNAFQVGSGADIDVEFASSGKITFNPKNISTDSYLFNILPGGKLVLENVLVSNFEKTFANSFSFVSALIYNTGILELNGAKFTSNKVEISTLTSAFGGLIYNTGSVIINSGTFANNTLNNKKFGGLAYGTVVYNDGGEVVLNGGTFSSNASSGKGNSFGGVVFNTNSGSVDVNSGLFAGNSANNGGVFANTTGSVTLNGGTMMSNKASESGAVLYTETENSDSIVYYNGSELSFNSASSLNEFNSYLNITETTSSSTSDVLANITLVFVMFLLICLCFFRVYKFRSNLAKK